MSGVEILHVGVGVGEVVLQNLKLLRLGRIKEKHSKVIIIIIIIIIFCA